MSPARPFWMAVAALWVAGASANEPAAPAPGQAAERSTVITARRVLFDYQNRQAVFEGDVVVTDPKMTVKADKMAVAFGADNQLQTIHCEGHVRLEEKDGVATGEKASYDVPAGKLVLTGNPQVQRGRDVLSGEKITYFRNEGKVLCEPATLTVFPGRDGSVENLFRE